MQPKSFIKAQQDQSMLSIWQQQISHAAKHHALKQRLLPQQGELLSRFAKDYERLKALPRRVRRSLQRKWKQSLAGIALLLVLGQAPALAATINVGGGCTLIAAIRAANTDTARRGCTRGRGADRIVLPPDSMQRLTEVNNNSADLGPTGLPVIRSIITIDGNGSTIRRVPGSPLFRILAVSGPAVSGSSLNLTLRETTVTGGRVDPGASGLTDLGGGVFSFGTLTITNSTISGNRAISGGGVHSYSHATITNSTISGNKADSNGGGVYTGNALTVTNSTISGNTAGDRGGGVSSYGNDVTVTNSIISGNTANRGGGVQINGSTRLSNSTISGNTAHDGGGVLSSSAGDLTVINSTISGNMARDDGGGVHNYNTYPTASLINSTISGNRAGGNGGGVFHVAGILTLNRTLISGNTADDIGSEVYDYTGNVVQASNFNLFGHRGLTNAQAFNKYFIPGTTDITATSDGNRPTRLRAILNTSLADNGGPTETHALVRGSPAIDAVTDGTCPPPRRDQRGIRRPQDGNRDGGVACDIGAFEFAPGQR